MARKFGSRLSDLQIIEIFQGTGPQKIAADEHSVDVSTVSRIRSGQFRPDVTRGVNPAYILGATLITAACIGVL